MINTDASTTEPAITVPTATGPAAPTPDALAALRPLPFGAARLGDGLLGEWQRRNSAATLPHCVDRLDAIGNITNLRRVTGKADGEHAGPWFADSDVYKTMEAAAWETARQAGSGDQAMPAFLDATAPLLAAAQDADGYLNSYYQVDHRDRQWQELRFSHELYCAGHLVQAAVAAVRAQADSAGQILAVARRFADLLVERFGTGGTDAICGHPEIETALVELYRLTGHRPYLELATRFVDLRGHGLLGKDSMGPRYYQDHVPVRQADEATGHVVRQLYLLAGVVDVAVENRDGQLLTAAERLWESAVDTKTYLTGGQGSRHRDEAFGDPYELPPDRAYAESCAAIAGFQLAWRLLLATGRARYADEMERLLYNGIASCSSIDGTNFFYSNPLQLRTGHDGSNEDAPSARLPWYSCACCPPNLARLMASLHAYVATADEGGLQLHLYAEGSVDDGAHAVRVATEYPWDGRITVTVAADATAPWTLALRIPAWCTRYEVEVDGEPVAAGTEDGYLRLTRAWRAETRVSLALDMPARLVTAHPRVDAVRGTVALARGPLVHCIEHADLPAGALPDGATFEDIRLEPGAPVEVRAGERGPAPVVLTASACVEPYGDRRLYADLADQGAADPHRQRTPVALTAIPYFLWANREVGPMRVWIPVAES